MEQAMFSEQELTQMLALTVYLQSLNKKELTEQMLSSIRRCWTHLQSQREASLAKTLLMMGLYNHYVRGYPMARLAELTGIGIASISRWFSRLNLAAYPSTRRTVHAGPPARQYTVNPHALDDPSIPVVGYVLGFLWADGHLLPAASGGFEGLRVVLQQRDDDQLQLIRGTLGSNAPITYPVAIHPDTGNQYPQCGLAVYSTTLGAKLADYGFDSRNNGQSNASPPAIIRTAGCDFWRGFIDGDGCIRREARPDFPLSGWSLSVSAPRPTCELFQAWLKPQLLHARIDIRPNGESRYSHVLSVSGPTAVEAMALLYPSGCVALKRKVDTVRRVLAAAEDARRFGIRPAQQGSRRQWVGTKAAKKAFIRKWKGRINR